MSVSLVNPPVLNDLMKSHVYIGYCKNDREPVHVLHKDLKSFGLMCSLRSSLDVDECSHLDNIKQGIIFSHKCLLYVSQGYLEDRTSKLELKEAKRKLKFLGKSSVILVIQSDVEQEKLKNYECFWQIHLLHNQATKDILINNNFLSDFELKPELSLMPKQNIGVGVAYTYFFGFLQMVVPGVWKKFEETMKPHSVDEKFLVKKMLIVIRKTVLSPPKLTEVGVLEQTKFSVIQCVDRSGREKREYTVPIYKLSPEEESKDSYYFVGDFPACLYAVREAYDRQLTSLSKDEVYEARNEFILTMKALLNHPDEVSSFANQWELLIWPDDEVESPVLKLSQFLYQQIKSKRLTELPVTCNSPAPKYIDRGTFRVVEGISNYPIYREGPHYSLKNSKRGYCVIINNSSFPNLPERTGATTEIEKLTQLFKTLKFEVETYTNLGHLEMTDCLQRYSRKDHLDSDAFVCCLLSHGDKGRISAADGVEVPVMELMKLMFENNCPGLKNKPKLFFIGACQGGERSSETSSSSTSAEILLSHEAQPSPTTGPEEPSEEEIRSQSSSETVRDLIPPTVDFIVSYATLPDRVAWAHPTLGGLYVEALCKHLVRDLEIDIALRYVDHEVKRLLHEHRNDGQVYSRQDPFHIIMPPHKFLFLGSMQSQTP